MYYNKYLKYKTKYLNLLKNIGGMKRKKNNVDRESEAKKQKIIKFIPYIVNEKKNVRLKIKIKKKRTLVPLLVTIDDSLCFIFIVV